MNTQALIAAVSNDEWNTLFLVLGLLCLGGAAYLAYLKNVVGALVLVFIAIVAIIIGADV